MAVLRNTYIPLTVRSVRPIMIQKDTYSVFQCWGPPKYVVSNDAEKVACRFRSRLELLRCICILYMLLECLYIVRINLPINLWRHTTHRALSPGLERMVDAVWGHLNWNVLVTTEWSDDFRSISKLDHVLRVRREEALQNGYTAIEDRSAFSSSLGVHKHLVVLHKVGVDTLNVRGRRGIQVH
jgi:hypothetical protein